MSPSFSLRKLFGLPRATPARARGNNFRRRPRRPLLELLEDRLAPATVAYQVPANTVGNQAFGGSLGMDFDVNQPIAITRLGVFDSGSDGLQSPLTARVYNRDTLTALATLSFAAGPTGTPVGGSRFLTLASPLLLPAGFHGTIEADGYSSVEPNGNGFGGPVSWTTDSGGGAISFVGAARYGFDPNAFPNNPDGGPAHRYAAGTFEFLPFSNIVTGPPTKTQGTTYTLNLNLPNPNITGWTIDWGDGRTSTISGNPSQATHVYNDDGPVTIGATATDSTLGKIGTIYKDVVLGNHPTAYYRLDETGNALPQPAKDETANHYDGTYFNFNNSDAGRPGPIAGDPASAISFNGTNAYVQLPNMTPSLTGGNTSVTISAWFKSSGGGVVVDEVGQSAINTGWHDSQIEVEANGEVRVSVWPFTFGNYVSLGTASAGTWHNAVVRYNQATRTLDGFLDGVRSATSTTGDRQAPQANGFQQYYALGATDSTSMGNGNYFSGLIDDVSFYSRALTDADVQDEYQAAVNGGDYRGTVLGKGPIAFYQLDETNIAVSTAADSSGNGRDATYFGVTSADAGQPGALADDPGTSVRFNGSGSYARLPSSAFNFTSGTTTSFESWFNTTGGGVILGQTNSGNTPGQSGPFGWVPAVYVGTDGKVRAEMFWHGFVGPITASGTYNDGQWHHVADVYNNGTETLYIDGVAVGSQGGLVQSLYNGSPESNYDYYLGTGFSAGWPGGNGGWYFFSGKLDEAAVYNTALTAQQVLSHYLAGVTPKLHVSADVTAQVGIDRGGLIHRPGTDQYNQVVTFTNNGADLSTPLRIVLRGLPSGDDLIAASFLNPDTGELTPLQVTHPARGEAVVVVPRGVLASLPAGQSFQLAFVFRVDSPSPFDYDTGIFSDPA